MRREYSIRISEYKKPLLMNRCTAENTNQARTLSGLLLLPLVTETAYLERCTVLHNCKFSCQGKSPYGFYIRNVIRTRQSRDVDINFTLTSRSGKPSVTSSFLFVIALLAVDHHVFGILLVERSRPFADTLQNRHYGNSLFGERVFHPRRNLIV